MKHIRFIRIFLLFLIIIGIGLLLTQKVWVPNVVDTILHSQNKNCPCWDGVNHICLAITACE
jgi:TM2 domain-containing membrane protein YozV